MVEILNKQQPRALFGDEMQVIEETPKTNFRHFIVIWNDKAGFTRYIYKIARERVDSTPLPYYDIIVEGKGKESHFFV